MKGITKYLAYLGAGLFFFVVFLFFTFPYDVLKDRIINQIEDSLGGQYQIKVQKMSASFLFGFTFRNVEVIKRQDGKDVLMFKTPKLNLNPSYLSLLRKNTDSSFSVQTTKGGIKGKYYESPGETRISLDFDSLNLADLKFLSASYDLNFSGVIDGSLDLKLNRKDFTKNSGQIDLAFNNLALEHYKIKLDPQSPEASMDLPKVQMTGAKSSKITAQLNKNELEIQEIGFKGGDLDLNLKGKLTIAPVVDDYRINLEGKFKLSPTLAQAIPLLALFEQQKQADGSYTLTLSGKFTKPSVTIGQFKLPF